MKDEDGKDGARLASFDVPVRLRSYAETTSYAILMLAEAVEAAMNRNDRPVLSELKRLCNEMFVEAEQALAEMEAENKLDTGNKMCEN